MLGDYDDTRDYVYEDEIAIKEFERENALDFISHDLMDLEDE